MPTKKTASRRRRSWRSRIVGHAKVDPAQLVANPRNWRAHPQAQQDALEGSLKQVGWVAEVMVNRRTGYIVDGHRRVASALARGEPDVPVAYVDLSPEEEAVVLASFDPIGALAGNEAEMQAQLIASIDRDAYPDLVPLLDGLATEAAFAAEIASGFQRVEGGRWGDGLQTPSERARFVKAVFSVPDLALVEKAIAVSGERNRGAALVAICAAYLAGQRNE